MKWNEYFDALKIFLETALGKEIEIESYFGKRVFRIADPDRADEVLFIIYNIQSKDCAVLRSVNSIVLPIPVEDLKLFPHLPSQEKIPERFIEDFLVLLQIEERKEGKEEWLE